MKKYFLLLIAIALIGINAYSQDLIPDENKKGKWGYVNSSGEIIIKHNYNEVSAFKDGRAKVRKGNKWGYIDALGNEVIKIQYSEMRTWNGDICKVAQGGKVEDGLLVSGGKWGFINRNGDVVLKCEYDEIGSYKDGLAHIVKGGKYGYIDENYQIFIPCEYAAIGSFNDKGFCWVNKGGKFDKSNNKKVLGGKFGIYNRKGELVVPAKYSMIGTFTHTPLEANPFIAKILDSKEYVDAAKKILKDAWNKREQKVKKGFFTNSVMYNLEESQSYAKDSLNSLRNRLFAKLPQEEFRMMKECGNYGLITYSFLTPEKFSMLRMPINEYFAVSKSYNEAKTFDYRTSRTNKNDKIGIINDLGEVILEPGKYPIVYFPTEGVVPVAQEKKKKLQVNYYDVSTKKLLFKKWVDASSVTPFINGVAVIVNDETQYLINKNGEQVSLGYKFILPPKNGLYIVNNGSYGVINGLGKEIISPSYNLILPISDNLMCAQFGENDKFGYLGEDGKYTIPAIYDDAKSFSYGVALVKTENGWGEINTSGQETIKSEWDDIKPRSEVSPKYSWVKRTGLWYGLEISNNKLITQGYADAHNFTSEDVAFVYNEDGLLGAINASDELIIPCRLSSLHLAEKCYTTMKEKGKNFMKEVDVYRFNLMNNDDRNSFRLTEKIAPNLWDF
jgi:hypothetical protein